MPNRVLGFRYFSIFCPSIDNPAFYDPSQVAAAVNVLCLLRASDQNDSVSSLSAAALLQQLLPPSPVHWGSDRGPAIQPPKLPHNCRNCLLRGIGFHKLAWQKEKLTTYEKAESQQPLLHDIRQCAGILLFFLLAPRFPEVGAAKDTFNQTSKAVRIHHLCMRQRFLKHQAPAYS